MRWKEMDVGSYPKVGQVKAESAYDRRLKRMTAAGLWVAWAFSILGLVLGGVVNLVAYEHNGYGIIIQVAPALNWLISLTLGLGIGMLVSGKVYEKWMARVVARLQ